MIDYKETKKAMGMRGIEFTDTQFSFALMIAIGIDKYDAYKIALVGDKINKIKEDKLSEFEDKCKKDCDVLLEVKKNWQVFPISSNKYDRHGRGIDFLGYVFYMNCIYLRKRIKYNFMKKALKLHNK